MEEEGQQSKFVCKFCQKKFSCGKALGGHIRSHVVASSAESDERYQAIDTKMNLFPKEFDEFGDGQNGYGLRDNPRKTMRAAVDSKAPLSEGRICKQCGKEFKSLKALCGHMACHSEKDKSIKDGGSWTSESHKMVMDGFSDTESDRKKLKSSRSFKTRQQKKFAHSSPFSSVSEIDGQEQEELAMSLMLLSRDHMHKGGLHSFVESSDNHSDVLETKSSSNETEKLGNMMEKKMEISPLDVELEDSDSEYFLADSAEIESNEKYGTEVWRKSSRRFDNDQIGYGKSAKEKGNYEDGPRKGKPVKTVEEQSELISKRSKYECFNCKKIFKSYQALGGHRPCNRRNNADFESRYGGLDEDQTGSRDHNTFVQPRSKSSSQKSASVKPNKGHACPFCDRVFKNGQALGGHKRSHFITGHDEARKRTPVMKPELPDLLDLNLPAPEAGEYSGHSQLVSQ